MAVWGVCSGVGISQRTVSPVAPADSAVSRRLAEAYRSTAPRAVRLAYLLTGDQTLAEDLVQDAFVRLAGRLLQLRDPQSVDAYIRRTVVNLAKNHHRHRSVERAYLARARNAAHEAQPPSDPAAE